MFLCRTQIEVVSERGWKDAALLYMSDISSLIGSQRLPSIYCLRVEGEVGYISSKIHAITLGRNYQKSNVKKGRYRFICSSLMT